MDSDADGVGDVEMDSDIPPPKKKLKGKKAESNSGRSSQARREKFHRENAKWLEDDDPAPQAGSSRHGQRGVRHIKNESDNSGYDNEDEDDEEDEDNIELVYGPKAPIRIGDQRPRIRKVLRYAISVIHEKIIYQHAFPSADIGPRPWSCQALYDGARSFGYTDIQERILRDEKYMEDMAAVSDARAASIRKKARDAAIASVAAYYGLDRDCTKHVQELMADEQYIFPGDIKNQTINRARPFQHPAIIGLLRTFFGHNGELRRHPEKFVVEGEQEPQLPAAMVAFAATAIHFALQCHTRPEKSMRGVQFSAAMYTTIFDMHMSNLEETREEKPAKYRHLMSKLYTEVVGPDIVPIVRRKGNAKRLFDLEGMSE
ncbi:hypothetical protein PLICRDRAFT_248709 [Plicaturopsis crispa FD-325 SS-3]|nr:hypothetical protein PLICRDRAFT_248709 [Plicaturopsis crispa FD-325 SS-3]